MILIFKKIELRGFSAYPNGSPSHINPYKWSSTVISGFKDIQRERMFSVQIILT